LFSHAAKSFGIGEQKRLKIDCTCSPRGENFEIGKQNQLKLAVPERNLLNFQKQ
jgi:hypothetical protein